MGRPSKYPRELRERAVRMVAEVRSDYPSEYQAMSAVAQMLGVGSPENGGARQTGRWARSLRAMSV